MRFRTLFLTLLLCLPISPSLAAPKGTPQLRLCSSRVYSNCVIDGDTFRWGRERVRLLDIDAPETHPSRCDYEAELGQRATLRLLDILNSGPWSLARGSDGRNRDQYGRLLRLELTGNTDAGAILVAEGLARPWDGSRHPWC